MHFYSLSQDELSVILGGLLGDSSYHKRDNIIVFSHSIKQKEYIEWKHEKLSNICNSVKQRVVGKSIVTGEDLINVSFTTKKMSDLKSDYKSIRDLIFDSNGVKQVNRKWLNMLNPLSLAVWWMDDGCLSVHKEKDGRISRFGKLCTHSFSLSEQNIIKDYFNKVWNIEVKITPEKNKFFLRFTVPNLKRLFSIIYPYVLEIPSMIYKINMKYNINKLANDEYKEIQLLINDITGNNI